MKKRIYLDNCCFNRPYDDQSLLRNHLEAEAKMYIQREIMDGKFELVWSYMMDYEVSFNPFLARKNQIKKWRNFAQVIIKESARITAQAGEIAKMNLRSKDSLHLACAMEANSDFFITTDDRILNKQFNRIVVTDPVNFLRIMEEQP